MSGSSMSEQPPARQSHTVEHSELPAELARTMADTRDPSARITPEKKDRRKHCVAGPLACSNPALRHCLAQEGQPDERDWQHLGELVMHKSRSSKTSISGRTRKKVPGLVGKLVQPRPQSALRAFSAKRTGSVNEYIYRQLPRIAPDNALPLIR